MAERQGATETGTVEHVGDTQPLNTLRANDFRSRGDEGAADLRVGLQATPTARTVVVHRARRHAEASYVARYSPNASRTCPSVNPKSASS